MMPTAEIALAKTLVDVFATSSTYDGPSFLERVTEILLQVDDAEVAPLPDAFASTLRVLANDLPRWRAATDVAVQLDLFEIAPSLLEQIKIRWDVHQVENLATLAAHPGVQAATRDEARALVERSDIRADLKQGLYVRLSPDAFVADDMSRVLRAQSWPGHTPKSLLAAIAPSVYLLPNEQRPSFAWHAAALVARSGGRVRRVPTVWHGRGSDWLSPEWPVVAWGRDGVTGDFGGDWAPSKTKLVVSASDPSSPVAGPRLLAQIEDRLPPGVTLRRRELLIESLPGAFSPQALSLGAFDVHEMAYLGAASRGTVQRVSKQGLSPKESGDVQRWAFNQLVTLRILQAFKSRRLRLSPGPTELLGKLRDMAEASEKALVGIDVRGTVYVDEGDGFRSLRDNQGAFDNFLTVDDAFRPFEVGGGLVPDLLRPSRRTMVHPATMGGTPVVEGHRVSARSLALLERRGQDVVRSAYPELSPVDIGDATKVGRDLLATI